MKDKQRENDILQRDGIAGDNAHVLVMTDAGAEMGSVSLQLREGTLFIVSFSLPGKDDFRNEKPGMEAVFILDSLMRAAASFGETHGADQIETCFPDFFGFFKARGFTACETHASTPMSTIVHYE